MDHELSYYFSYYSQDLPGSPKSFGGQIVPVVGNAREAVSSAEEGLAGRAIFYTGLAILDATGLVAVYRITVKVTVKAATKVGLKEGVKSTADDVARTANPAAPGGKGPGATAAADCAAPVASTATSTTTSQINPRLLQRLEAFRSYQANGGTMDMRRWVQATQGNPAYGTGFRSGYADWIRNVERGGVHPNSLLATGPHDVYVIRDAGTGHLLHFGETGRGYLVSFAEHQRDFAQLGIRVRVDLLDTVEGRAASRILESRYIDTYRRLFGLRPPFNLYNH